MGHIQKRGANRYKARYRDASGSEHARTFVRKIDAKRFLTSIEGAKLRGDWTDPRLGQLLYSEWVAEWVGMTRNLRPSTRARNDSYIRSHILPAFGQQPLAAIGQIDVRKWVAKLDDSHLAPATTAKAYQILAQTLQAAVDAGLLSKTPCRNVPLPKVERREMRVLTPSQVADLADAIHPRFKALVLLAAYGGLRIGELAGLKRQNVDLLRGQVEVVETLVEVAGTLHTNPPKTRAGRRQVGIPKSLAQELQRHIQEYGHAGNDYVFTAPQGGPLRVPAFRSRFWQPAVKLAGLDGLTLHELRHTAVSLWISAGGNPTSIAARAGHTSAAFTHDRYGHMFPEDDLKLSETLETFIQSAHTIPG